MIFKRVYHIEKNRESVIVTDEGEFPIWSRDFERSFSSLSSGDEIECEDTLRSLAYRREIKKKAIRRLSAGDITKKALKRKLLSERAFGAECDGEFIDALLDKLSKAGYIDDGGYAKRYLSKCVEKLWGEKKIRGEMMLRGFESEDIDRALEESAPDFLEMARTLIKTKYEGAEREAIFRRLLQRGFRASEIEEGLK